MYDLMYDVYIMYMMNMMIHDVNCHHGCQFSSKMMKSWQKWWKCIKSSLFDQNWSGMDDFHRILALGKNSDTKKHHFLGPFWPKSDDFRLILSIRGLSEPLKKWWFLMVHSRCFMCPWFCKNTRFWRFCTPPLKEPLEKWLFFIFHGPGRLE